HPPWVITVRSRHSSALRGSTTLRGPADPSSTAREGNAHPKGMMLVNPASARLPSGSRCAERSRRMLAADYPFLDVFWTILVFFVWVAWFILLFRVIADIFRRHDIGGGGKVLWLVFVII